MPWTPPPNNNKGTLIFNSSLARAILRLGGWETCDLTSGRQLKQLLAQPVAFPTGRYVLLLMICMLRHTLALSLHACVNMQIYFLFSICMYFCIVMASFLGLGYRRSGRISVLPGMRTRAHGAPRSLKFRGAPHLQKDHGQPLQP